MQRLNEKLNSFFKFLVNGLIHWAMTAPWQKKFWLRKKIINTELYYKLNWND